MLSPRLRPADDLLDGNLLFTESCYRIQNIPSVVQQGLRRRRRAVWRKPWEITCRPGSRDAQFRRVVGLSVLRFST